MAERFETIKLRSWEFGQIYVEIFKGFCRRDPVLYRFMVGAVTIAFLVLFGVDRWAFSHLHILRFYPTGPITFRLYAVFVIWFLIFLYGVRVRQQKKLFQKDLKEVFELVGLKNPIGSYPRFLSLEPITGGTIKLRLTNGSFPLTEWRKKKERLEANLHVFIDEIREVPEKGFIDMTFSYEPMPERVTIENLRGYRNYTFLIGRDRTKSYTHDFSQSPHMVVAGETGGGKSVFLRQLIVTIKINQPEAKFRLVDLKGGVEFGYLSSIPGVEVISEINHVSSSLKMISGKLDSRIEKLKGMNMNDIKQFFESNKFRSMSVEEKSDHVLGHRIFVVVDECAELFLFGSGHAASDIREIRSSMSRITRLGRSVGIHVILATQRPDKNAVDPQVKTNLTSTVCYRVHDHGGSLAILGTGRATDLPKIPGRAILQQGSDEIEIQTPFLDFSDSKKLLEEAFHVNLDELPATSPDSKSKDNSENKNETSKHDTL